MKEKLVYIFDKDGKYTTRSVDRNIDRIGYLKSPSLDNPYWHRDGEYTAYTEYREPERDYLEVKTLNKIISIDRYNLDKGIHSEVSLIKDNLNYGYCTGSYEKAMGFGRDFRLELHYATVKDSPLYTIFTELEKMSKGYSNKDTEHQKDINRLVNKIKELEKENSVLAEHRDTNNEALAYCRYENRELKNENNFIQNIIDNPNTVFLYVIFINYIKNLFKTNK